MRFEITHENGQKEIKEFRGDKAVVGSGDNSDILIPGEHVAKNQIILEKIEGKIYVTDLDNENGTYINDELIEPHKRIEFLSFFPVQIGPKVFIHLLPDEEHKPEQVEKVETKITTDFEFTPPPPKKNKTEKKPAVLPESATASKKTITKSTSKPNSGNAQNRLAMILIGLTLVFGYFIHQISKDEITPEAVASLVDPQITLQNEMKAQLSKSYETNLHTDKCRNPTEKAFCNTLSQNLQKQEGFMIENRVLYLYINLDRNVGGAARELYGKVPHSEQFHYFLVNTIFNYQFLHLLEEYQISHLNFVLFNIIEGHLTLTKYFSNSVEFLLKNVAIDDIQTSLAEAYNGDPTHLSDILGSQINWTEFK